MLGPAGKVAPLDCKLLVAAAAHALPPLPARAAASQLQQLQAQLAALPTQAVMRDTCGALLARPPDDAVSRQLLEALQQLQLPGACAGRVCSSPTALQCAGLLMTNGPAAAAAAAAQMACHRRTCLCCRARSAPRTQQQRVAAAARTTAARRCRSSW